MTSSTAIIAKEVFGYVIMTAIAVAICMIGLWLIWCERTKPPSARSPNKVIYGIIIASCGSVIMLLTVFFLLARTK